MKNRAVITIIFLHVFLLLNCNKITMKKYQEPDPTWFYNLDSINFVSKKVVDTVKVDTNLFKEKYYRVWGNSKHVRSSYANWGIAHFKRKSIYGVNKKPHYKFFLDSINSNIDIDNYGTINRAAITVDYTDIKIVPTSKPIFYDFTIAGEGYPFDNNQNSSMWANTPIRVLHESKDGRWVFVNSPVTTGWIESSKIAYVNKKLTKEFKSAELVVANSDDVSVFSKKREYYHKAMIGSVYPMMDSTTFAIIVRDENGFGVKKSVKIDTNNFSRLPIEFTNESVAITLKKLINNKYGWGGLFEGRDCSSTLRDLYIQFGLLLPRSSSYQRRAGEFIPFDSLSTEERLVKIREEAIPYRTLFHKRGHIMLYVGSDENRSYMFHNIWGIKTEDEENNTGRIEIGRTVITDVEIGKNVDFVKNSILEKFTGMTILFK